MRRTAGREFVSFHVRMRALKVPLASTMTNRCLALRPIQSASSPWPDGLLYQAETRVPENPFCGVQRYEDAHALIPGEVGTRQVASEQPRVGNSPRHGRCQGPLSRQRKSVLDVAIML